MHYTVGDEGVIGDLSSEGISAHFQWLPANILVRSNLDSWLNFDARTISVA